MLGSNNPFPSVLMVPQGGSPEGPVGSIPAGYMRLFVRLSDGRLCLIDDSNTVFEIGGSGDVTGPGASVDDRIATFNGTDGDEIQDGGMTIAEVIAAATGGAGMVLLEQHTASSSGSLDFTTFISSSYDSYVFKLQNILPATSTDDFWIRFGTGGGPTWDTGANYTWAYGQNSQIPNATNLGTAGDGKFKIGNSLSNTSTDGASGEIDIFDPLSTSSHKLLSGRLANVDSSGNFVQVHVAGRYVSTTAVTGVRFLFSSGNIASGTIRVYGLLK